MLARDGASGSCCSCKVRICERCETHMPARKAHAPTLSTSSASREATMMEAIAAPCRRKALPRAVESCETRGAHSLSSPNYFY